MRRLLISAAVIAAIAPAAATASTGEPSLEARAILPADATWTGQPVGGFSALLDAGSGRYWAMPDNGFGTKLNSTGFLLRVYKVRPNWGDQAGRPRDGRDPQGGHAARPFIVHTDATGKVLDSPTPTPGIFSPDNPYGRTANIRRFSGRTWTYRMSRPDTLVSDATVLDRKRIVVLERDNGQGPAAQWKRAFLIDTPGRQAVLKKEQIVDLLALRDRKAISLPARPGDFGLGDPFSFPYVTVEAVLPVSRDRLAFVNDTNFGSTGRNPALPDYSDFIGVEVPGLG